MRSRASAVAALIGVALGVMAAAPVSAGPSPQSPDAILNQVKQGPYASIGPLLGNLYEEYLLAARGAKVKTFKSSNPLVQVVNDQVAVDMVARNPSALAESLRAAGATQIKARGPLVSARVPVSALGRLAALDSLNYARPVLARTNGLSGPVVSQGVASMNIEAKGLGYTGKGVTVGVLSDSFACNPPAFVPGAPTSTAEEDPSNGELPLEVNNLLDACPGSDEGRAMAQIVHDVAPGAAIAFHTAFAGEFEFAEGIIALQKAGADVTVDDVIYFAEPMFSDGPIAQAVDIVAIEGVPHFSSAGNNGRASYEAPFVPVPIAINAGGNLNGAIGRGPVTRTFHDFSPDPGVQLLQPVLVQSDGVAGIHVLSFQWDQPHLRATAYAWWKSGGDITQAVGAASDLDLVFFTDKGTVVPLCPPGVARGITCQITGDRNVGGDAVDLAVIVYSGPKPAEVFYVGIVKSAGPDPGRVKYVPFDIQGGFIPLAYDTKSGTSYGHANAAGALSIGAASWYATLPYSENTYFPPRIAIAGDREIDLTSCDPACLNDFSSAGGVPILLDKFGKPVEPELRENPSVTGPDGGNSTFFFADSSYDDDDGDGVNSPFSPFISCCDLPGDEWPNFFGTSASAPHVAGVAALMLEKDSNLEPSDVRAALQNTARPISKRFTSFRPVIFEEIVLGEDGYDYDAGHGLVDAKAALDAIKP